MTKPPFQPFALIDSLTAAERKELSAALAFRATEAVNIRLTQRESRVWDAVCEVLDMPRRGRMTIEAFAKSFGLTRYQAAVETLHGFIDHATGNSTLEPARRDALVVKCLECLLAYITPIGGPRGPAPLLGAVQQLSPAVERQFPGYARARLLHLMVRPEITPKTPAYSAEDGPGV